MAAAAMIKSSGTAKTDTMTTDVEKEAASRSASSLSLSGGFLTAEGADGGTQWGGVRARPAQDGCDWIAGDWQLSEACLGSGRTDDRGSHARGSWVRQVWAQGRG